MVRVRTSVENRSWLKVKSRNSRSMEMKVNALPTQLDLIFEKLGGRERGLRRMGKEMVRARRE